MAPHSLKCHNFPFRNTTPPSPSPSLSSASQSQGVCWKKVAPYNLKCRKTLRLPARSRNTSMEADDGDGLVGDAHMDLGGGQPSGGGAKAGLPAEPHLSGLHLREKVRALAVLKPYRKALEAKYESVFVCRFRFCVCVCLGGRVSKNVGSDLRTQSAQMWVRVSAVMSRIAAATPLRVPGPLTNTGLISDLLRRACCVQEQDGGGGGGDNGELVLKFECQMYKSRDDEYLIDMQRLSGDALVFIETVSHILAEMRV